MKTWWKSGSWNACCDICARKFKAEELVRNWRGQMVCQEDYESRNEQELIRPIKDQNKLPWTKPRGTDTFVSVPLTTTLVCNATDRLAIAGMGKAACMIAGKTL